MREVIDYYKNFENGFYEERIRNKKEFICRGNVTIQLFKEGELVEEVKSENCICEKWVSALYLDFINEVFLKRSRSYISNTLLQMLVLSTNNNDENPQDILTHGNMIGYADINNSYSGADTERGTVNLAESSMSEWSRHIVVDFPTHAANGTFQSVYMKNGKSCGEMENFYSEAVIPGLDIFGLENKGIILAGIVDTKYYVILEYKMYIYRSGYSDPEVTVDLPTIETHYQGKIYNNNVYIKTTYGNIISIYSGIDLTLSNQLTIDLIRVYDFAFKDDFLYIVGKEDESYGLYKYTTQGVRLEKLIDLPKSSPSSAEGYVILAYYKFIFIPIHDRASYPFATVIYNTDTNMSEMVNRNIFNFDFTTNHFNYYRYQGAINMFVLGNRLYITCKGKNDNTSLIKNKVYTIKPYISHTKLPAPITKTSANTMKIQYDYEIEPKEVFE